MYNERQNIERVLQEAQTVIPQLGFEDYEVLVIDDGSRDGCDRLVEASAKANRHIRLVRHAQNMGYGAALRTGFNSACKEVVAYTDCDLPADLRELEIALMLIDEADLVIGYRKVRYETLRRAVYSRIYNLLMRVLFDVHVRDVNFSFKLVRRSVLDQIHLTAGTVFIDGQLLAEARRHGYRIAEIPIDYTPRRFGKSNFDRLQTAWDTLVEMMAYALARQTSREARPASLNANQL
jgi:glycosyltransferase involved in cell wall biosynthesis